MHQTDRPVLDIHEIVVDHNELAEAEAQQAFISSKESQDGLEDSSDEADDGELLTRRMIKNMEFHVLADHPSQTSNIASGIWKRGYVIDGSKKFQGPPNISKKRKGNGSRMLVGLLPAVQQGIPVWRFSAIRQGAGSP